jgi:ribosome biogenesis protein BMS1
MPVYLRIVAFQSMSTSLPHFRICATGDLIENNKSFEVVKKLKLIGEPYKIEKKTAFIRGMFNSSLEVAKYIGAEVKTVSGIRGQIKKEENKKGERNEGGSFAIGEEGGCFRATFEDKILKSDIVFLRTWSRIEVFPYCFGLNDYANVKYVKTTSEIRQEKGIVFEQKKDSEYKEIIRKDRVFPSLMIPQKLENALPFKSKSKSKGEKDYS